MVSYKTRTEQSENKSFKKKRQRKKKRLWLYSVSWKKSEHKLVGKKEEKRKGTKDRESEVDG